MIGYPKTPKKKPRMRHPKSILQEKDGTCYLCVILHEDYRIHKDLHEHHIFSGTANRKLSEQYGLKVYLCPDHHEYGAEAVHKNKIVRLLLEETAKRAFEKKYPEESFREIFGRE